MDEPERRGPEAEEDDEGTEHRLALAAHRHVEVGDAVGRVEPEDVQHRADRGEKRAREEVGPEGRRVFGYRVRQNHEQRQSRKKWVADRREDAGQVGQNPAPPAQRKGPQALCVWGRRAAKRRGAFQTLGFPCCIAAWELARGVWLGSTARLLRRRWVGDPAWGTTKKACNRVTV